MKKILTLLLCAVMVMCMMPSMAWAADQNNTFKANGIRYLITGESTVSVISTGDYYDPFSPPGAGIGLGSSTYSGEIAIPETVKDGDQQYSVTAINPRAFSTTEVTKVTIPSSVRIIGAGAFYNCTKLTEVHLSEGLEGIDTDAFSGCFTLSTLSIPSTVTKIGTSAFGNCRELMSLNIPAGVTEGLVKALVGNTFYPYLDKVTIAEGSPYEIEGGVLYKGTVAQLYMGSEENVVVREGTTGFASNETGDFGKYSGFYGVFSHNTKVKSVTLPDTITSIPARAFYSAVNLETVILPDSITSIGDSAFYNTGLTSISLPDSVETIGASAFQGCTHMVSAELPSGLKTLGKNAFIDTYELKSIEIPYGITEIPEGAFAGRNSLETIVIPGSVTSIGKNAFSGLKEGASNTTLIMQGTTPPENINEEIFGSKKDGTPADGLTLIVPAGSEAAYGSNSVLKTYITTTGDQGEEAVKPGISYALTLADKAQVAAGKTATPEFTSTIPTGAVLAWKSADTSIAKVDENGVTTGVKAGTAVITASITINGVELISKSCTVTVSESSNSGGYYPTFPTVQKPTIETSEGASVTLNSIGTTAAITVADGYELVDVTVNGVSKGAVTTLTGLKTGDKVVVTTQKIETPDDNAALIEAVKNTRLVARSLHAKAPSGKKSIKVYWFNKDGSELDFDGYEVYRSLKKDSGYGTKPIFKTTKERYFNTAIKKGTRYYYKVRGYKVINGEKVYTPYSLKAWRIAK